MIGLNFKKIGLSDYLESDEAIYSQFFDLQMRPSENIYSTFGIRNDDHKKPVHIILGELLDFINLIIILKLDQVMGRA